MPLYRPRRLCYPYHRKKTHAIKIKPPSLGKEEDDAEQVENNETKEHVKPTNGGWSLFYSPYFGEAHDVEGSCDHPWTLVQSYQQRLSLLTAERNKLWSQVIQLQDQLHVYQKNLKDAINLIRSRIPLTFNNPASLLPTPIPLHPRPPTALAMAQHAVLDYQNFIDNLQWEPTTFPPPTPPETPKKSLIRADAKPFQPGSSNNSNGSDSSSNYKASSPVDAVDHEPLFARLPNDLFS